MEMRDIVDLIKADMGNDVVSLAISDSTIELKVKEALRKVASYAPKVITQSLPVYGERIELPEGTIAVHSVLSTRDPVGTQRGGDDIDIFSAQTYILRRGDIDPFSYLLQKNELDSMMNFIELTDWYFEKDSRLLYLNYYNRPAATVKFLKKYIDINEVTEDDVLDVIKNYALALCKIIEGNIRRKLQQTPGAMLLDGDALVSEGTSEKQSIEDSLPRKFGNIRFGFRS